MNVAFFFVADVHVSNMILGIMWWISICCQSLRKFLNKGFSNKTFSFNSETYNLLKTKFWVGFFQTAEIACCLAQRIHHIKEFESQTLLIFFVICVLPSRSVWKVLNLWINIYSAFSILCEYIIHIIHIIVCMQQLFHNLTDDDTQIVIIIFYCLDVYKFLTCFFAECAKGEYSCDVTRCIPISSRCDGLEDCTDNTDEQECSGEFYNIQWVFNVQIIFDLSI